MKRRRIYVASSWKNLFQPGIVHALRAMSPDHEVYDFRTFRFDWRETIVNPTKRTPPLWTTEEHRRALGHPLAEKAYDCDMEALDACDDCVLVLPCGKSAHWELGYALGQGKRGIVVMLDREEPELMYSMTKIVGTMDELFDLYGFAMNESRLARD